MSDQVQRGWWLGGHRRNLALSTWNRIDGALARPMDRTLFGEEDFLEEPFLTLRKISLALSMGDPQRLERVVLEINMTDMRLLLGVKYKLTLGQLAALLHNSTNEVVDRAHRLVTDLAYTVLYDGLEGVD